MKNNITLAAATVLTISLGACTSPQIHDLDQANKAIIAAETANAMVKKVNYEWNDTGKIIKKALQEKATGNFDMAVKSAKKAENQAKNAFEQYKSQRNAKPRY